VFYPGFLQLPPKVSTRNNFAGDHIPDNRDDMDAGYGAGSWWIFNQAVYLCVDGTISNAVWQQIVAATSPAPFVGTIVMGAVSSTPALYLPCDGAAVSRATYADLFAAIGTSFGVGNGTSTFNVPDMRGRAPIGVGTGSGLSARALADKVGVETHALSTAELAVHNHAAGSYLLTSKQTASGSSGPPTSSDNGGIPHTVAITGSSANAGSGNAHQNMQPSLAVNFYIYTGV